MYITKANFHSSAVSRASKTFKHQAALPPLPVLKLEDTCAQYLRLLSPLVSSKELEHTKEVVTWFSGEEGQQLQNKLVCTALCATTKYA
jgi:carnitine O-acetyltransferase